MNVHKLITDIKSELPHNLMVIEYEAIESFFDILCWGEERNDNTVHVKEFATAFFMMYCGHPYEENDWLDRIYQIIDGRLIKP